MLQKQKISIPLARGLNTKEDDKQVMAGDLLELENAVFETPKKIKKRNGYTDLAKTILDGPRTLTFSQIGSSIDSGSFLALFKDELLMGDGHSLFSFSESDDEWGYKGRMESCRVSNKAIFQDQQTQHNVDTAVNTTLGLTLFAWEIYDSPPETFLETFIGIGIAVVDNETNQVVFRDTLDNTTSRPRCVSIGSNLYVVYVDSDDNDLHSISVTTESLGTPASFITDIDTTTPNYDLLVVDDTTLYVAYNGTSTTVKIASFNSSLVSQNTHSESSESAPNGICIFEDDSDQLWIGFNDGTDTKAFIRNADLSTEILAVTDVETSISNAQNITGIFDGTQGIFFYDQPGDPAVATKIDATVQGGGFNMPAVDSTINITFSNTNVVPFGRQIIFVNTAGYFLASPSQTATMPCKNLGLIANAAPTTPIAAGEAVSATIGRSNSVIRYNTLTEAGTSGTAADYIKSCALVSRAFINDGVASVIVGFDDPVQPTYFLTSLYNVDSEIVTTNANISAKIFANEAGGIPNKSVLSNVNLLSGNTYKLGLPRIINLVNKSEEGNPFTVAFNGVFSSEIDMEPSQISRQQLGDNLHIASGVLQMYDGNRVVEHNFHLFPKILNVSALGSTGFLSAGTYSWIVVYTWTDAQGNIHRSTPSDSLSLTASANDEVRVSIAPLRITEKENVTIEVYRTLVNGSIYYRVDTQSNDFPISNDITLTAQNFDDDQSDNDISGNEILYTSGEIQNNSLPAPISLSTFKNRLVVVSSDKNTSDFYSKQVVSGSPVETSLSFTRNTDQSSGSVINEIQMDDKNVIFKETSIFVVVGTGPSASGANNDFTEPTLIASDVGLVDRNSLVLFPNGVLFKSNKGIYLLDRSLNVQYIGDRVEDFNGSNVISAKLRAKENRVIFFLSNGKTVVYDYFVNNWSSFTNHSSVDADIFNNLLYYLASDGTVKKETDGTFSDSGTFIPIKVKTPWLSAANLQGFQRVYRVMLLGEFKSNHSLQVKLYRDFSETSFQTITITPTSGELYQFDIRPSIQKCQAMQIEIQDVETDTIGESFDLSNIAIEVGIKQGLNKLPASKTNA